jgi:hypothetical protein
MSTDLPEQSGVAIDVDYYDEAEAAKIQRYQGAARVAGIVPAQLVIPTAEFLTYFLFHAKRSGSPEFNTSEALRRRLDKAMGILDGYVQFNGTSLHVSRDVKHLPTHVTEFVGEAVGLATVGRLHGLTDADWDPIEQEKGPRARKTLDYRVASDGERFVETECKGSVASTGGKTTDSIRVHHRSIAAKKASQRADDAEPIGGNATLRYGTIAVISGQPQSTVRCLLTDPPPGDAPWSAQKGRLISRLRFIRNISMLIAPRSQFTSALATRIASLEALRDPDMLGGAPLLDGRGQNFRFAPGRYSSVHSEFGERRTRVIDGPAMGVSAALDRDTIIFVGMQEGLLSLASEQDPDEIRSYAYPIGSIRKVVAHVLPPSIRRGLRIPPGLERRSRSRGRAVEIEIPMTVQYSSGGAVFALATL